MGKLYREYGLVPEDVFEHSHYKIITRQGIDKILSKSGISFEFVDRDVQYHTYFDTKKFNSDSKYGKTVNYNGAMLKEAYNKVGAFVTVRIRGGLEGGETISTFGESNPYNTTNEYPIAMAEKRAKSRLALMATGLYAHGFFGEDEADDFKQSKATRTASFKS